MKTPIETTATGLPCAKSSTGNLWKPPMLAVAEALGPTISAIAPMHEVEPRRTLRRWKISIQANGKYGHHFQEAVMIKEWLAKFKSMIKEATVEVPSSGKENLVSSLEKSLEYCIEENKVLREVLQDTYECKRVKLTNDQKRRLAAKAIILDKHILSNLANIFQPETVLGWYRELLGKKVAQRSR